jgi:hypothetical protein
MVKKILLGILVLLTIFLFAACSKVDYITCEDDTAVTDFSLCPEYVPTEDAPKETTVVEDITPGVDVVAEVESPDDTEVIESEPIEAMPDPVDVECYSDEDCGDGELVSASCQFDTAIRTYDVGVCKNPGTKKAFCKLAPEAEVVVDCGVKGSCSKGECITPGSCYDKDNGLNYDKSSRVVGDVEYKDDTCLNETTLIEYFCDDANLIDSVEYDCPRGCEYNACK